LRGARGGPRISGAYYSNTPKAAELWWSRDKEVFMRKMILAGLVAMVVPALAPTSVLAGPHEKNCGEISARGPFGARSSWN